MIKIRSLLGLIVLIAVMAISWAYFSYQQFLHTPIAIQQPLVFEVKSGSGATAVVEQLAQLEVISQPQFGQVFVRLNPELTAIKAGRYALLPEMKITDVFALLTSGQTIQYSFTLVEGINIHQLIAALRTHPELDISALEGLSDAEIIAKVKLSYEHPEGAFFADTYHFPAGYSAIKLLERAHQRLLTVLQQEWQSKADNLPYQRPYDALIMASIIEKETAVEAERPVIAGVFVRRLQKRMRLQTDPTVIYGIGVDFDGNITRKHLRTDTPYNTYTRHGLPPTPIAMVGRAAINAALNPAAGTQLYFVAKGDGSHYFSDTLEEHNKAVRKYQLKK
ncbi:MAG: endolytic transglycosylase MltG [Gammaproteobacteria bacterium]|nr:endolytic transglycosylase MltG [Gammaproteobacteria bacterium]NVK87766.1 endolytic transglycosylase MltG [Gammaproteobacteria bacterium]